MDNLDFLLKNMNLRYRLSNCKTSEEVVQKLDCINRLLKVFPKTLDDEEISYSLNATLFTDYSKIVSKLPEKFVINKAEDFIHVGNANQLDIYYTDSISEKKQSPLRVACMSFYFVSMKKGKELVIETVQGDIRTDAHNVVYRDTQRMFGKLNTFYGVDWRQGLLQQVHDYGVAGDMKIIGKVPGIFHFISASTAEYPLYALYYLSTYLKIGIPLENISFNSLPSNFYNPWKQTVSFLKTKTDEEKISLVQKAAGEYRKLMNASQDAWLNKKIYNSDFHKNKCEYEFRRVFAETFS